MSRVFDGWSPGRVGRLSEGREGITSGKSPRPMLTLVALVDSHPSVCEELARVLDSAPDFARACVCPDGETALCRVPASGAELVVIDLELPGMSGAECVARLKQRQPGLRVLVHARRAEADRVMEILAAGADGHLVKGAPPSAVLAALRELRAGGAALSAEAGRLLLDRIQGTATPQPAAARDTLTPREREVLDQLVAGQSSKEIARGLAISDDTVKSHLKRIYQKLGVRSRLEAALHCLRSLPPVLFSPMLAAVGL